jgi:hypothetical protein
MVMHSDNGQLFLAYGTTQAARTGGTTCRARATLDLPASQVLRPNELYDRVFAFACDVLGLATLEVQAAHREGELV